jgi:hypothetical protein
MTGKELARAVRAAKGKVAVPVLLTNDVSFVYAEKQDLIATLEQAGDSETGMKLSQEPGGFFIERDYGAA